MSTVNKYFSSGKSVGSVGEQNLLENLIIESIKIFGEEVWYIPRTSVKPDIILGEDVLSQFTGIFPIEAFLNNIEGWGGNGELMTKFGIQVQDEATFIISRRRWMESVSLQTDNIILSTRPDEGSLIYFPKTQAFFEITFVDHLNPFYQLNKFYIFSMQCSMFRYSSESISTGNAEVDQHALDNSLNQLDYILTGQNNLPILDQLGNPIITQEFDSRTPQPTPNDGQDLKTETKTLIATDEKNLFGEI